jgi:hypothetical protein
MAAKDSPQGDRIATATIRFFLDIPVEVVPVHNTPVSPLVRQPLFVRVSVTLQLTRGSP